jgi:hypothetical protein
LLDIYGVAVGDDLLARFIRGDLSHFAVAQPDKLPRVTQMAALWASMSSLN